MALFVKFQKGKRNDVVTFLWKSGDKWRNDGRGRGTPAVVANRFKSQFKPQANEVWEVEIEAEIKDRNNPNRITLVLLRPVRECKGELIGINLTDKSLIIEWLDGSLEVEIQKDEPLTSDWYNARVKSGLDQFSEWSEFINVRKAYLKRRLQELFQEREEKLAGLIKARIWAFQGKSCVEISGHSATVHFYGESWTLETQERDGIQTVIAKGHNSDFADSEHAVVRAMSGFYMENFGGIEARELPRFLRWDRSTPVHELDERIRNSLVGLQSVMLWDEYRWHLLHGTLTMANLQSLQAELDYLENKEAGEKIRYEDERLLQEIREANENVIEASRRISLCSGGLVSSINDDDLKIHCQNVLATGVPIAMKFEEYYSPELQERIRKENPETIMVEGVEMKVEYGKDKDHYFARISIDPDLLPLFNVNQVRLPSGRLVELECRGQVARFFSELRAQIVALDQKLEEERVEKAWEKARKDHTHSWKSWGYGHRELKSRHLPELFQELVVTEDSQGSKILAYPSLEERESPGSGWEFRVVLLTSKEQADADSQHCLQTLVKAKLDGALSAIPRKAPFHEYNEKRDRYGRPCELEITEVGRDLQVALKELEAELRREVFSPEQDLWEQVEKLTACYKERVEELKLGVGGQYSRVEKMLIETEKEISSRLESIRDNHRAFIEAETAQAKEFIKKAREYFESRVLDETETACLEGIKIIESLDTIIQRELSKGEEELRVKLEQYFSICVLCGAKMQPHGDGFICRNTEKHPTDSQVGFDMSNSGATVYDEATLIRWTDRKGGFGHRTRKIALQQYIRGGEIISKLNCYGGVDLNGISKVDLSQEVVSREFFKKNVEKQEGGYDLNDLLEKFK